MAGGPIPVGANKIGINGAASMSSPGAGGGKFKPGGFGPMNIGGFNMLNPTISTGAAAPANPIANPTSPIADNSIPRPGSNLGGFELPNISSPTTPNFQNNSNPARLSAIKNRLSAIKGPFGGA